jgi:putative flippase GtrA
MKRTLLRLYRAHREKVLYLIVGGWNTAFQYGVFSLCWYLLGNHVHPVLILLVSYLVASVNGFLSFRYLVFRPVSHPLVEYLRYQAVYIPILVLNMVALPLILKHTRFNAYVAQTFFIIVAIVAAYVGNKYFTFRQRRQPDRG